MAFVAVGGILWRSQSILLQTINLPANICPLKFTKHLTDIHELRATFTDTKSNKEESMMANIAYVRVSSSDQNTGRQREILADKGIERWYEEKISGKDTNRPKLQEMLDYVRDGDVLYIESISRLARNTRDFLNILEQLERKGVKLVSAKENIDTSTPTGRFMVNVFASLAELERGMIRQRQQEGIALARHEGRPYGRPGVTLSKTFAANYQLWKAGTIKATEFMATEGLKKSSFYKLVKRYEDSQGK